jgi:transcriptional regulator with XRE-family HTH domain
MPKGKEVARAGWRAIGERVQALRRAKGWNRTSLAARAEVTVTTIRGCEEGTKVTQPDKLRAIAKALGVPMSRLEVDEKDPRLKHWNDEDYEIGNWYHNAPRAVKNPIWVLHEIADAGSALTDPMFLSLLAIWPALTQTQKVYLLNALDWLRNRSTTETGEIGGADAIPSVHAKVRNPQ